MKDFEKHKSHITRRQFLSCATAASIAIIGTDQCLKIGKNFFPIFSEDDPRQIEDLSQAIRHFDNANVAEILSLYNKSFPIIRKLYCADPFRLRDDINELIHESGKRGQGLKSAKITNLHRIRSLAPIILLHSPLAIFPENSDRDCHEVISDYCATHAVSEPGSAQIILQNLSTSLNIETLEKSAAVTVPRHFTFNNDFLQTLEILVRHSLEQADANLDRLNVISLIKNLGTVYKQYQRDDLLDGLRRLEELIILNGTSLDAFVLTHKTFDKFTPQPTELLFSNDRNDLSSSELRMIYAGYYMKAMSKVLISGASSGQYVAKKSLGPLIKFNIPTKLLSYMKENQEFNGLIDPVTREAMDVVLKEQNLDYNKVISETDELFYLNGRASSTYVADNWSGGIFDYFNWNTISNTASLYFFCDQILRGIHSQSLHENNIQEMPKVSSSAIDKCKAAICRLSKIYDQP